MSEVMVNHEGKNIQKGKMVGKVSLKYETV
jgi:hypothetical protein